MAPVARHLARRRGILEPIQTATSLDGQVEELRTTLDERSQPPVTLIGFSWGAWLSFIVAARYPALVRKLVLVGSGPFEERYVEQVQETRLARLSEGERAAFEDTLRALNDPTAASAASAREKDALLARLGALAAKTDGYDPLAEATEPADRVTTRGEVFQRVWTEAAQLRRTGELLDLGWRIRCPVVAIHGDYDPHPAEGVRQPLAGVLGQFRFIRLEHCGHKPWVEQQARDAFYRALEEELD